MVSQLHTPSQHAQRGRDVHTRGDDLGRSRRCSDRGREGALFGAGVVRSHPGEPALGPLGRRIRQDGGDPLMRCGCVPLTAFLIHTHTAHSTLAHPCTPLPLRVHDTLVLKNTTESPTERKQVRIIRLPVASLELTPLHREPRGRARSRAHISSFAHARLPQEYYAPPRATPYRRHVRRPPVSAPRPHEHHGPARRSPACLLALHWALEDPRTAPRRGLREMLSMGVPHAAHSTCSSHRMPRPPSRLMSPSRARPLMLHGVRPACSGAAPRARGAQSRSCSHYAPTPRRPHLPLQLALEDPRAKHKTLWMDCTRGAASRSRCAPPPLPTRSSSLVVPREADAVVSMALGSRSMPPSRAPPSAPRLLAVWRQSCEANTVVHFTLAEPFDTTVDSADTALSPPMPAVPRDAAVVHLALCEPLNTTVAPGAHRLPFPILAFAVPAPRPRRLRRERPTLSWIWLTRSRSTPAPLLAVPRRWYPAKLTPSRAVGPLEVTVAPSALRPRLPAVPRRWYRTRQTPS
ncbi:hypothetical protein DFH09DRAFT_1336175 [Mycena vulgaris]|nr:hypothetical protein DFH09DRAFT_1336175 [Mycena vulgaris]